MKLRLLVRCCVVMLGIMSHLCANHPQENYLQAHELYKAGKFDKAYELYQDIANKTPTVHYNLGNCAYKMGNKGRALLHWRRAEQNWGVTNRYELRHNIKLIKKDLQDQRLENQNAKQSFIVEIADSLSGAIISLIQGIPLLHLQIFFLCVWFLLFMLKRAPIARLSRYVTMPLLCLVMGSGFMLAAKYGLRLRTKAVVVAQKAIVRSGPGESFQQIMTLKEGEEGIIKKTTQDYYKVLFHGNLGWVSSEDVEKV